MHLPEVRRSKTPIERQLRPGPLQDREHWPVDLDLLTQFAFLKYIIADTLAGNARVVIEAVDSNIACGGYDAAA